SAYNRQSEAAVRLFPDEEALILPTSFGNAMRAFEAYPRIMYGADSIPTWFRLGAVVSPEFSVALGTSKAIVDNCVNVFFLALLLAVVAAAQFACELFLVRPFHWKQFIHVARWDVLALLAALALSAVAYRAAKCAAIDFGNYVKAAF